MSTTLLFAELLIVGLQAGLWLFLLSLCFTGVMWLQTVQLAVLADWQALIVVVGLAFLYVVGIIIDRLADTLFAGWERRLTKQGFPERKLPLVVMRFATSKDNEHLNHQYEYNRSRMRITRASSVNFALTTGLGLLVLGLYGQGLASPQQWGIGLAILIVGAALTLGAVYSWQKLMRGYIGLVRDSYLHQAQPAQPAPAPKAEPPPPQRRKQK